MGLFGLFKKKENIQPQREVDFNDINPLDFNSIIDVYKAKKPNATEADVLNFVKQLAAPDKDQEHLTAEGNLPWGWHTANKSFTDKVKSEYNAFLSAWITSRKGPPMAQYNALKSFVVYMNDVKQLCESKGECFVYWRDELFTDDYLKKRTEELNALERAIK